MTREEAITVLKAFMENPLFSEVHKAAFNIAIHDIKAYQDWNINNLILVNKDNYEPIEQEPTTKNDLGVDCISRADAIRVASGYCHPSNVAKELAKLPSVTPQEPQSFKWCTDCKEYDQEKHCCHRWSKVIRDTVEEMKQEQEPKTGRWNDIPKYKDIAWQCSECKHFTTMKHNYCPNCGCRMVEPQESEDKE